jgi:hypothetical protein
MMSAVTVAVSIDKTPSPEKGSNSATALILLFLRDKIASVRLLSVVIRPLTNQFAHALIATG